MSAEVSQIWQAHWQPASAFALAAPFRDWLLNTESLTARLKALPGEFSLQLCLEQPLNLPAPLASRWQCAQGVVREVVLKVDAKPCVYAQSLLPIPTMQALTPLASLGEKPLGEFIFQQPGLQRGAIEIAHFAQGLPALGLQTALYGRRSFFSLDSHELLVQELFLPGFIQSCNAT